jgi:hypothetical protein
MRRTALTAISSFVLLAAVAAPASAHTLGPASHNFGDVKLGSVSPLQVFTVTAEGGPFQVSNFSLSGGDFPMFDDGDSSVCAGTLADGQSCTFGMVFRPTKPGPQAGTITVSGGNGSLSAQLSGNGVLATSGGGKKKKKCKKGKKRSAAAAKKKCKKK